MRTLAVPNNKRRFSDFHDEEEAKRGRRNTYEGVDK